MTIRIAACLLVAAALVFACIDDPSSPPGSGSGGPRAHRTTEQRERPQTIDEEFAAIANAESTFGGFFFDSMHVPVVYLTNTSRLTAARAAGLDAFLNKRRISAGNIRVVPATYGFGALKRWYECAAPLILGLPHTTRTDIDEAHNRLRFSVAMPSAQRDVETIVTQCEIPSEAVTVDVVLPVVPSDALNESVEDSVRPLRGGTRIKFYFTASGFVRNCTLGVIGQTEDGLVFITNGHCSQVRGQVDTTSYWQVTVNNSHDSIGRETLDPSLFTYPTLSCPSGKLCRMSDANLSLLHSTATAVPGLIARTQSPVHGPSSFGSTALDLTHPGLFITGYDESGPASGDSLCKTGYRTGTTCGAVTQTCFATPTETGSDTVLICQSEVNAKDGPGDSGSPVYHWTSSADSTVVLAGILWGHTDATHFVFSQWGWVVWELVGSFDELNPVAETPYIVYNDLGGRVSGPTSISVAGTSAWDAYAFAGTGSYSYQWKYKNDGSSTWNSLGTSASQTRYADADSSDFTMRAIIVSGSDTVVQDILVDVNIISGVDIGGPSWVHEGVTCSWTASPAGGTPPYSYAWDGGGDSDTYYQYVLEHFWVGVTVTDVNGGKHTTHWRSP